MTASDEKYWGDTGNNEGADVPHEWDFIAHDVLPYYEQDRSATGSNSAKYDPISGEQLEGGCVYGPVRAGDMTPEKNYGGAIKKQGGGILHLMRWALSRPRSFRVTCYVALHPGATVREIADKLGIAKSDAAKDVAEAVRLYPSLKRLFGKERTRCSAQRERRKKEKHEKRD